MIRRFGRTEGLISLIIPALFYGLLAFVIFYSMWPYFYYIKNETFIVLGAFAIWRYGWLGLNYVRSVIYSNYHYPRLRNGALQLADAQAYPEHIFFIIPSYKEETWVTVETFQSILSNLSTIPSSATLIVATGCDEDDRAVAAVYQAHPARDKVELVLQRQSQGKRTAMGHALRAAARRYDPRHSSITIFMDGDSYLEQRTLTRALPFFTAYRDLGALTTNEAAYINTKNIWYKDWFNLKFGQRHVLFKSHALSHKVLTLTGRFSMFRTDIVVQEAFIQQIENDILTLWMYGKFRFLMGDDKSSWYYLLEQGWQMLYLPDVTVYSLESRDASFLSLSTSLPYRWYGNTLRNNSRALKLGWRKTGLFIWFAILDQRLSMWTSLVGITGALILTGMKSFVYLPFYLAWVLCVRIVQMSVIALRGHPVSLRTIPLMLYNQWVGAFIKIHAGFHLSNQSWSKGDSKQESGVAMIQHRLVRYMPDYMMVFACSLFIVAMLFTEGTLVWPERQAFAANGAITVIDTRQYGVKPDDGLDDALALQHLIDHAAPGTATLLQLPPGVLDINYGLTIRRNDITLRGMGSATTLLRSHLKRPADAVIKVLGRVQKSQRRLLAPLAADANSLALAEASSGHAATLDSGDYLLLKRPNDAAFFEQLGNPRWHKSLPWLRQSIVKIRSVEPGSQTLGVQLVSAPGIAFTVAATQVQKLVMVRRTQLENFTLEQIIPGVDPARVQDDYENRYPDYAVDALSFDHAADCRVSNVVVLNAGRHPINLESSYGCSFNGVTLDGAWNKGKSGNGYLRIARSHHNLIAHSQVRNIRHITLQWSASYNTLQDLQLGVDINFHGGYSHHNQVRDIHFDLPPSHPWKAVTRTPENARWAPPDGPGNQVSQIETNR